ncbi:putative reverse transcriptase zinc-binding domain-containing protein [Helianthus anomalus]
MKAGKELESMGVSITDELTVEVGNGKTIKFWLDRWSGDRSLRVTYPKIFKIAENKHARVADYVTVLQNENQWFITCSRPPNTDEEWSQWSKLLQQINGSRVSGKEDRWGWKPDRNGIFSVAAVRNHLNKVEANQEDGEWKFWNKWVPPKVNYFSWRAALEKISVKRELARRGMSLNNLLCPRCGVNEETVDHLICECMSSQRIWKEVSNWLKVPSLYGRRNCKELLEHGNMLKGSGEWKKIINVVIQAALWNIWKSRNDKEFEGHLRNEKEILDTIKEDSFIWVKMMSKIQGIVWERWVDFNIRDVVR